MARLVTIQLQRSSDEVPWGFRLQGGADYNQPLSVQRVTPGSLAAQYLSVGDVIIMIEGADARKMCHFDACELIKCGGNEFEMVIRKANSEYLCDENFSQQEMLEEKFVLDKLMQAESKKSKSSGTIKSPPFSPSSTTPSIETMSPRGHIFSPPPGRADTFSPQSVSTTDQRNNISQVEPSTFDISKHEVMLCGGPYSSSDNHQQPSDINSPQTNFQRQFAPQNEGDSATSSHSFHTQAAQDVSLMERTVDGLSFSSNYAESRKLQSSKSLKSWTQSSRSFDGQTQSFSRQIQKIKNNHYRRVSSPTGLDRRNRSSCSPQKIIPPLPKTIFPINRPDSPRNPQQSLNRSISSPAPSSVFSPKRALSPPSVFSPPKLMSPPATSLSQGCVQSPTNQQDVQHLQPSLESEEPKLTSQDVLSPPLDVREFDDTAPNEKPHLEQSFQDDIHQQYSQEVNPKILTEKLEQLQQSNNAPTLQPHSLISQPEIFQACEQYQGSQERIFASSEDLRQRHLQLLIQEKVRLEELMMLAKRKQGVLDARREKYASDGEASEEEEKNQNLTSQNKDEKMESGKSELVDQSLDLKALCETKSTDNTQQGNANNQQHIQDPPPKTTANRQKEEESRLRELNRIRDEKIRKMQEKKYEEKLRKNLLKSSREKSCPPLPGENQGNNKDKLVPSSFQAKGESSSQAELAEKTELTSSKESQSKEQNESVEDVTNKKLDVHLSQSASSKKKKDEKSLVIDMLKRDQKKIEIELIKREKTKLLKKQSKNAPDNLEKCSIEQKKSDSKQMKSSQEHAKEGACSSFPISTIASFEEDVKSGEDSQIWGKLTSSSFQDEAIKQTSLQPSFQHQPTLKDEIPQKSYHMVNLQIQDEAETPKPLSAVESHGKKHELLRENERHDHSAPEQTDLDAFLQQPRERQDFQQQDVQMLHQLLRNAKLQEEDLNDQREPREETFQARQAALSSSYHQESATRESRQRNAIERMQMKQEQIKQALLGKRQIFPSRSQQVNLKKNQNIEIQMDQNLGPENVQYDCEQSKIYAKQHQEGSQMQQQLYHQECDQQNMQQYHPHHYYFQGPEYPCYNAPLSGSLDQHAQYHLKQQHQSQGFKIQDQQTTSLQHPPWLQFHQLQQSLQSQQPQSHNSQQTTNLKQTVHSHHQHHFQTSDFQQIKHNHQPWASQYPCHFQQIQHPPHPQQMHQSQQIYQPEHSHKSYQSHNSQECHQSQEANLRHQQQLQEAQQPQKMQQTHLSETLFQSQNPQQPKLSQKIKTPQPLEPQVNHQNEIFQNSQMKKSEQVHKQKEMKHLDEPQQIHQFHIKSCEGSKISQKNIKPESISEDIKEEKKTAKKGKGHEIERKAKEQKEKKSHGEKVNQGHLGSEIVYEQQMDLEKQKHLHLQQKQKEKAHQDSGKLQIQSCHQQHSKNHEHSRQQYSNEKQPISYKPTAVHAQHSPVANTRRDLENDLPVQSSQQKGISSHKTEQKEETQKQVKKLDTLLKESEKILLEKIIREEERKLLEKRRRLEEKKKREQIKKAPRSHRRIGGNSLPTGLPIKREEQKEIPQKTPQQQHPEKVMAMNTQAKELRGEDLENEEDEEVRMDELRKLEEQKMKEEAKLFEEYKRHLEYKRRHQVYDSDEYTSESDPTLEERRRKPNTPRGVQIEEKFEELNATSEEELYEAQEKSIRNLERQIRRQKQKEMRRLFERNRVQAQTETFKQLGGSETALHESASGNRQYRSTGDLRNIRTRPITKFSPDPMEFGFRPIETPHSKFSKSTSNLMACHHGPSASSIAHVAGAEAGVAAQKNPNRGVSYQQFVSHKPAYKNYRSMSSLDSLQQVSQKPPLPAQAKLRNGSLRHVVSEENIRIAERPSQDPRRHTYSEGEEYIELPTEEEEPFNLEDMNCLLNEYYAAYYQAYYQSFFRRQQTELKGAKMETAGPPPPPPPPPFQTAVESAKPLPPPAAVEPSPMVAMRAMHKGPPAALAGAMMKDKKPFTYTPGGIDLSEIKSPRMQRRLQKNAACEGVRPSPLAQQQPPSPTTPGAVPPLPPQGMVQVLPVPGMAMAAPVKKPQPKEPPKPKRNVCGPPPPPPPFSISSSSADPSPSPTPYDSPSSTPAMNSTTSPSTPADVVAPVFPATPPSTLPSASSSSTPATPVEHSTSSLQPVMASEPGPSVPLPPPLPPTARKLEVRKDLSSSTEAEESVASPPSITSSDSNESERPQINAAPKGLTTQLNEVIEELKQKSASPVPAVQEEPTHETQPEETAKSQEEEKDAEPEKKKTSRPVTPKSHESRWGLKDGEPSQALPVEDPAPNQLPDRTSPVVRRSEDSRQSPSISASKRHSNQLEYSLRQDPHIRDALKEQGKSERTTQDSQNKVQPLVQPTLASPLCNDRPAPREDSTTQEKEAGQRNRPWMRMPSPPVNTSQKQTKQPKDRLVRQASLPAQPVSPQATLPTAVAGSLYIPPVEQSQDGGVGSSATPSSGGRGDTSSPLDKGPLPWMRAHRKEASPPPEFMVQAQKTQERLQRQRSKAEESRKQQLEKNSPQVQRPQLNQISYQSLPSYTEPQTDTVIPPPDIFKDQIPVSQPAWRGAPGNAPKSDHYRDSPTYQAHQQVQQQQQQLPAQQNPFFQEYQPNQEYQQYPNQSPLTQLQRPRERIIPIMLEGTPPTTPVKQNPEFYNPGPHQQLPGRQASWPTAPHSPYSAPPYPMNVPVQEARASSNALEALQQMQQNLAQLNTGLQTGSKDMHRELCKTLAERISQKSAQPPNKQNGGAYSVPVQMAPTPSAPMNPGGPPMQSRSFKVIQNVISNQDPATSDDELASHSNHSDPQANATPPEGSSRDQNPVMGCGSPVPRQSSSSSGSSPSYKGSRGRGDSPRAGRSPATPKFFKVLQVITDTLPDQEDMSDACEPEPRKYTGSNIPSRSFKMLQAMTDNESYQQGHTDV